MWRNISLIANNQVSLYKLKYRLSLLSVIKISTFRAPEYPSVAERNFKECFVAENPGVRYFRHPTGAVVFTLNSTHSLMRMDISAVIWEVSPKKGGIAIFPDTKICRIRSSDGTEYLIRAGIKATLLETNIERLNSDPNCLKNAADKHGFIAIFMTNRNLF